MPQRYALNRITTPALEPVSLDEAKSHLRVEDAAEDGLINTIIAAARSQAESYTGRALVTQVWEMALDGFRWWIDVPRSPLQAVESVSYIDGDGVLQILDASAYRVDNRREPGRITPAFGTRWPRARDVTDAVTVRFRAGYGDLGTDVPADIRQAILLIVGRLYAIREDVVVGTIAQPVPGGSEKLMSPHRIMRV